jgi:hypothetical protein
MILRGSRFPPSSDVGLASYANPGGLRNSEIWRRGSKPCVAPVGLGCPPYLAGTTSFTLTFDDVELMDDESSVFELGILEARAYVDPSATAKVSPGPET